MITKTSTSSVFFDNPSYIDYLNQTLSTLSPQDIIRWAMISVPHLYQTTAFGLTGLAILDMVSAISKEWNQAHAVPVVFIDTLYHFPETLSLADKIALHYSLQLHTFKPQSCETVDDFERVHGKKAWTTSPEMYDFAVKVEPAHRAYQVLNCQAVLTGRRRSQKGDRSAIPILEIDASGPQPILKINPMAYWSFDQVWTYIQQHHVPYNELMDKGYKSIGDWHSTQPTQQGQDERQGRWAGQEKTECGLHKDYFIMRAQFLQAQQEQEKAKE